MQLSNTLIKGIASFFTLLARNLNAPLLPLDSERKRQTKGPTRRQDGLAWPVKLYPVAGPRKGGKSK